MRAIVKAASGPGLELVERPVPEPGPRDVLIRVEKASICGTDVHIDQWDAWAQQTIRPPLVIGHEFVGEVAGWGDHVQGFAEGERVTAEGHITCGQCRNCLAGRRHLCAHTLGVGVQRDGAFADYVAVPAENVWHAHPALSSDVLSCFDPLGNAVHTALTYELLGEDVLITGAGPIGCMACGIARFAGARHVVVTDVNPHRLELARQMGASEVLDVRHHQLRDVMKRLEMKEGFDVGLEMSGNPAALATMVDHMFHGGRIALLGILPDAAPLNGTQVIFKALTLRGIYGRQMFETWYKTTVMLRSGLDLTPIITHRFPVADYREAFDLMASGQSGKIILEWR